jgi:hypothetical protein
VMKNILGAAIFLGVTASLVEPGKNKGIEL